MKIRALAMELIIAKIEASEEIANSGLTPPNAPKMVKIKPSVESGGLAATFPVLRIKQSMNPAVLNECWRIGLSVELST